MKYKWKCLLLSLLQPTQRCLVLYLFAFLTVVFPFNSILHAEPNEDSIGFDEEYDSEVQQRLSRSLAPVIEGGQRIKRKTSDVLFNLANDMVDESFDVGPFNLGLKLTRSVRSNFDLSDSYTVIDRMEVPLSLPILKATLGTDSTFFGAYLGSEVGLEVVNIRTVLRDRKNPLSLAPTPQERLSQYIDWHSDVESWPQVKEAKKAKPKFIVRHHKDKSRRIEFDNEDYARYMRFTNQLTSLFRIPLSKESFQKLEPQEIISWKMRGEVQLGVHAGAATESASPLQLAAVKFDAHAFIGGEIKYTVMKATDGKALVKWTFVPQEKGTRIETDLMLGRFKLFDLGFVGLPFIKVGSQIFKLQEKRSQAFGQKLEFVFEFDMEDRSQQKQYEKLLIGQLDFGKLIDGESDEDLPMEYSAEGTYEKLNSYRKTAISFLVKKKESYTFRSEEVELSPSGDGKKRTLYNHQFTADRTQKTLWGDRSSRTYEANHREEYHDNLPYNLSDPDFLIEGHFQDRYPSLIKLNAMVVAIEDLFDNDAIFPDLVPPGVTFKNDDPETYNDCLQSSKEPGNCNDVGDVVVDPIYGNTRLRFGVALKEDDLRRFAMVPDEQKEKYIGRAYGVNAGGYSHLFGRMVGQVGDFIKKPIEPFMALAELVEVDGFGKLNHGNDTELTDASQAAFIAWRKLSELHNNDAPREKFFKQAVLMFYESKTWTYPLIKLVLEVLRDQKLDYFVDAKTSAFPDFKPVGKQVGYIESPAARQHNETANIELTQRRVPPPANFKADIKSFKKLADGSYEVVVELPEGARHIFAAIEGNYGFFGMADSIETFVYNDPLAPRFEAGLNTISIKPEKGKADTFEQVLGEGLLEGRNHRIKISVSRDGRSFSDLQVKTLAK